MQGDNDGRDRAGGTSGQVLINGRLDNVSIDGISSGRAENVEDGDSQDSPENDPVPGALVLHRFLNVREDNVASVRESKGGKGDGQVAGDGDVVENGAGGFVGVGDGVKVLGVDDGSNHDDEDNDGSRESAKNGEEGDLTHSLGDNNRDDHNGGGDHNPLLQGDSTSDRRGEVMDVASSQNQVENGSSQGDRVVEEGDDNTARETEGSSSNVGVLSEAVTTIRRKK